MPPIGLKVVPQAVAPRDTPTWSAPADIRAHTCSPYVRVHMSCPTHREGGLQSEGEGGRSPTGGAGGLRRKCQSEERRGIGWGICSLDSKQTTMTNKTGRPKGKERENNRAHRGQMCSKSELKKCMKWRRGSSVAFACRVTPSS